VDVLWVAESRRGQGLGQRLLSHVEEEGRRQGARRVELNTFGFQAPGFYEKLGYRLIGKVEPSVRAYGHYYYEKDLKALFPTWKQGFDAHH
jgi:GNAT superfamily N-acetyltransferase